ncbi:MAG: PrsW family intramembrane metalloprotease [Spirochaetes bacterium]|nr:PrsW family intramembrane metalloprotease [Spirochaetota bacterium]
MHYLILGFAPGLFWLYYFYKKDKFEPEPKKLIIRAFLLGLIIAVPVAIIESLLKGFVSPLRIISPYLYLMFFYFFIVGPVEEYAKYIVVKKSIYNSKEFNEPMDGIIYCIAAGLGFASIENVGYMIEFGTKVIVLRAVTATLAHALFSGTAGYYLGLAKFNKEKEKYLIFKGLLLASFFHGLYDFLLMQKSGMIVLMAFLLLIILFISLLNKIRKAGKISPFKKEE